MVETVRVRVSSVADQDALDTFSAEGPPSAMGEEEVREKAGSAMVMVSPDWSGIWGVNVREISPGWGVGG